MQYIKLLFKKDTIENVSSLKVKKDILGVITSLLLITLVYGVFIYVFKNFAKIYVGTDFGNSLNQTYRIEELLTVSFCAVFVVNVVVGVRKINTMLTNGKEDDILIYQPIDTGTLFFYKLLKIYFSQLVSTILTVLPITISIDLLSNQIGGSFVYYLLVVVTTILLPFISCAFATLLSIPYIAISKKIQSKFTIKMIIYVVIVGVAFYFYSMFLHVLSSLVRSGNIRYVFDMQTINKINSISKYLYPSKFFSQILLNSNAILNILIVVAISGFAVFISYFIIKKMYLSIIQENLEGNGTIYSKKIKIKSSSQMLALIKKEFTIVFRTPTYAFQYFAMSITLPFMVYVCAFLLESMLETLTIINCNYALSIFVVSMFSILTNTFCTTNISRDGKMFGVMKTLPITIKQIVNAKVLFCSIVSICSIFISSLVLFVTGFLNLAYFVITFVIGVMFSFVQIAYATRKDMKNPSFPNNDKEEVIEGNANMSTIVLTSLILTALIGGGSILLSIILSMKYNQMIASIVSIGFIFLVAIITFLLSFIYLYKGLKNEYYIEEF